MELFENADVTASIYYVLKHAHGSLGITLGHFAPGGILDQVLDGDVPSRFQKHSRSLYQFFPKYIPDLIPIFQKYIPDLIPIAAKIAKIDTIPYTKIVKIDTVPYNNIVKIDTLSDGTSPYPEYV